MPRRRLAYSGGNVFHVLNRSVRGVRIFANDCDYHAFENLLIEAMHRTPTRLIAYCVMPTHWHLVCWPTDDELPRFMHWLTVTHVKRWHRAYGTSGTGPVYQSRYKAVPVRPTDLLTVIR